MQEWGESTPRDCFTVLGKSLGLLVVWFCSFLVVQKNTHTLLLPDRAKGCEACFLDSSPTRQCGRQLPLASQLGGAEFDGLGFAIGLGPLGSLWNCWGRGGRGGHDELIYYLPFAYEFVVSPGSKGNLSVTGSTVFPEDLDKWRLCPSGTQRLVRRFCSVRACCSGVSLHWLILRLTISESKYDAGSHHNLAGAGNAGVGWWVGG